MTDMVDSERLAALAGGAPNKRETIKRILASAKAEFAAKGLAEARIDLIAQGAGVTKQLVYHYFRSKEDLFACVLEESSSQTMQEIVACEFEHLPPREALRALLHSFLQPYRDPTLSSLAQEGIRYHESHCTPRNSFTDLAPELNRKMRQILERGAQSGVFRRDVDPDLLLAAAALASTGAFVNRYTVSTLCGLDLNKPADAETWHRFSVDFIMSAVESERSALHSLFRRDPSLGTKEAFDPARGDATGQTVDATARMDACAAEEKAGHG